MYSKIKKYEKNAKENKKKKLIISCSLLVLIIMLIIIFLKLNTNMSKNFKIGNNSTSQEIVDYILNIKSYEAQVEIETKSNKNNNRYIIKQTYIDNENNSQEVLEPSNIKGLKIVREKNNLKIENTKLSITKIIENYKDITSNNLDLISFIENYKNNKNSSYKEENNQIIMTTVADTENNYQKYGTLYVSKEDGLPIKLEIKDNNQNISIYIIYNKIQILK